MQKCESARGVKGPLVRQRRCSALVRSLAVWSKVEVAQRSSSEQGQPAPPLMLPSVMQHVAALTERFEVAGAIVGRIVINVRAGEEHAGHRIGSRHSLRGRNPLSALPLPSLHTLA